MTRNYLWLLGFLIVASSDVGWPIVLAVDATDAQSLWSRKQGSDWPRMLGPASNGHSTEKGILADWSNGKLSVQWHIKTGTGYGNCVASQGRCFQFDRFGENERLTCYHAETGKELWSSEAPVEYADMYGYNNGPRASPIVDEDRVYTYGVAGRLAAYDLANGKLYWEKNTEQEYRVIQNFFGVGSTPCVFDEMLIAMVGGSPAIQHANPPMRLDDVKPDNSAIVAFNKRTGEEIYRVGNYLASYSAPIIAEMFGQPWCVVFVREGLLVFDPRDGTKEAFYPWRASTMESVNAAWPVVVGNRIFISETYEKGSVWLEFDGKELKSLWNDAKLQKSQSMRSHWATPIYQQGFLFGCSGRNEPDADLRCVQLSDGDVKWVHRNRDRTTCLAVDGHLIVLGEHGLLQLIRATPERFELITELDLGEKMADDGKLWIDSPSWAPPVLSHGLLYLRGQRRLVCLELIPE
ncbi:MAG: PQQ-binding-like beta-propeller repeat protein [Pirellulaceae bacterium]|nr:PQQ-binding-like beta-propeller repeat protein [Pirellulaceae bacterium]